MAGDFERRLLEVERRLGHAGLGLERTRLRTLQGLQEARQLWSDLGDASGQYTTCAGTIIVTVTSAGVPLSGAAVTVTGPAGYSSSGTTGGGGTYTATITRTGYYTATATSGGCLAGTTTRPAACGSNAMAIDVGANRALIAATVTGCNGAGLSGFTVQATLGGTTVSGTTDAAGHVTLDVSATGAGVYTITVPGATGRFVLPWTGTATAACGATANVAANLTIGASYACASNCTLPIKTTLPAALGGTIFANLGSLGGGIWQGVFTTPTVGPTSSNCGTCGAGAGGSTSLTVRYDNGVVTATYPYCTGGGVKRVFTGGSPTGCSTQQMTVVATSNDCPLSFLWNGTLADPNGLLWAGTRTLRFTE